MGEDRNAVSIGECSTRDLPERAGALSIYQHIPNPSINALTEAGYRAVMMETVISTLLWKVAGLLLSCAPFTGVPGGSHP